MRMVVAIVSVVALALLWVGLFGIIRNLEDSELEQLKVHAQRKVNALSSAVQATMDYYDFVLLTTRETVPLGAGAFARQNRAMSENLAVADGARLFLVEDEHIVASSSGPVPRSYVGDRPYFRFLTHTTDDLLVLDPPVMSRITSTWIVPFARGVFRDDKLTNIVMLGIPLSSLQKRLNRYLENTDEIMSLLTPDGQFILRTGNPDEIFGKRVPANRFYLQHPEIKNGSLITTETSDGSARLIVWIRLPGNQIAVSSLSIDESMAPVKQTIRGLKLAGCAVSALVLALVGILLATLSRTERLARQRHDSERQFSTLFDAMSEGVIELDGQNCITRVNPAFTTITGYAAADVTGQNADLLSPVRDDARKLKQLSAQWDESKTGDSACREGDFDGLRALDDDRHFFTAHAVFAGNVDQDRRLVLLTDVSVERRKDEEIWYTANFDALTGLVNRALLLNRLELMIPHVQAHQCGLAVLFIDLDYFVPISEKNGITVSNRLLYEVARRLHEIFHEEDTIARLQLDQFGVLFSDFGAASVAERTAARVVSMISDPFTVDAEGSQIEITCSVGLARYPDHGMSANTLLQAAKQAMLRAKDKGRSHWSN
jgi:diguanylate cyclase (GGDEF)-like protein